jgi:hypothetical protein
MPRIIAKTLLVPLVIACVAFAGCLTDSDPGAPNDARDADDFESIDLASEDGGYTEQGEAPYFGDDDLAKAEVAALEPLEETVFDAESLESSPLHDVYYLRIAWGQLDGDSTNTTPTDWSGRITLVKGGVKIQRVIFFEGPDDQIVRPRTDRRIIEFVSTTTTHHDGLLLRIYDPLDDMLPVVNQITFETGPFTHTFDVASLDGLSEVFDVDALGNQVSFRGGKRPPAPCLKGYLTGFWGMNAEETRGRFGGVWVEQDGRVAGHVRGHFGVNDEGERVLFGKFISRNGAFMGRLRGTYEPNGDGTGSFTGQWLGRGHRLEGEFSGRYAVRPNVERMRGFFEGEWASKCAGD